MKWYDNILNGLKTFFNLSADATESEIDQVLTEANAQKMNSKKSVDDDEEVFLKKADFDAKILQMQKQVTDLEQSVRDLKQSTLDLKTRVAELEKMPAAEQTNGATDDETANSKQLTPMTARAIAKMKPEGKKLNF